MNTLLVLVLMLVLLVLVFHVKLEKFTPATENTIGPPVQYIPDPDITINLPEYNIVIPLTQTFTSVIHAENFKFPESVMDCVNDYIAQYVPEKFILDNVTDVFFKENYYIFNVNVLFTADVFSKKLKIYMRVINNMCDIISVKEEKEKEKSMNVVYGKMDNRYKINNVLHLLPPFT
jgi:hypothetical protein